ncbi:MAG: PUA domain-containing protein, partial [Paracoccaceae bacterium]
MAGGAAMAITLGSTLNPLQALEDGAPATWFFSEIDPAAARKRWIGAMKPRGELRIDAGAASALTRGKSLLPAGVTGISGTFERGDPVAIVGPDGQIALGLTRYTSHEAIAIQGQRSEKIEAILGYPGRAALIHRDDMAV